MHLFCCSSRYTRDRQQFRRIALNLDADSIALLVLPDRSSYGQSVEEPQQSFMSEVFPAHEQQCSTNMWPTIFAADNRYDSEVVFACMIRRMCVSSNSSDASGESRKTFKLVPSPWDVSVLWRSQHYPDAPPLAKASKIPGNIDEEDLGNECVGPEDLFPGTFTPLPLRELSDRMK